MYNFSAKQLAVIDCIRAIEFAQTLCKHDPLMFEELEVSRESLLEGLIAEIGRGIVLTELRNKGING